MSLKKIVPWRIKLIVKILLGKLKLTYFFQKIKIFSHGGDNPERCFNVFNNHFLKVKKYLPKSFTVLEIGPGYSIASAVFASCFGASFTYLVDKGSYASEDIDPFLKFIKRQNIQCTDTENVRYQYLTKGVYSLKETPDRSIDFIFSNAVLEHVSKKEFSLLLRETRRVVKESGVCSHTIDLKDHLGESLNSLRYSEKFWESNLVHNSGFYTNRLRFSEIMDAFQKADFRHELIKISKFNDPPLNKEKMDKRFQSFPNDDLIVSGFHVLLFPKSNKSE